MLTLGTFLLLAVILVIINQFHESIIRYFKLPPKILSAIIIFLVISVYFIQPLIEHCGQVRLESKIDRIDQKLDELKGDLRWKNLSGQEEQISQQGIKKRIDNLQDEFSIVFWFTPKNFENPDLQGKFFFFDLYSQYPDKNRVSMLAQKIKDKNNLVVEIFDARKNSFLIRQNISEWKDGNKHFIALTFSIPKNSVILYIDGVAVQKVNIDNLFLDTLGPNLILRGSYLTNRQ